VPSANWVFHPFPRSETFVVAGQRQPRAT